jgi:hypothetical protein
MSVGVATMGRFNPAIGTGGGVCPDCQGIGGAGGGGSYYDEDWKKKPIIVVSRVYASNEEPNIEITEVKVI